MTRNDTLAAASMLASALGCCGAAAAGGPQTWFFDETTSGEDIAWTSPTAVDPQAHAYQGDYLITQVVATVSFFGFPTPVDVTGQIPPENLAGSGQSPGPAPVDLINQALAFPAPPEPPTVAADVFVGLDATGHGVFSATNVVLGSVEVPPFGSLNILSLRVVGQITVTPLTNPADINRDGAVDVLDLVAVVTAWGDCPGCPADTNQDGAVDVLDLIAVITAWS
jgi:hypothetical protein